MANNIKLFFFWLCVFIWVITIELWFMNKINLIWLITHKHTHTNILERRTDCKKLQMHIICGIICHIMTPKWNMLCLLLLSHVDAAKKNNWYHLEKHNMWYRSGRHISKNVFTHNKVSVLCEDSIQRMHQKDCCKHEMHYKLRSRKGKFHTIISTLIASLIHIV